MIKLVTWNFDGTIVAADKLVFARVPTVHAAHEIHVGDGRTIEIYPVVLRHAV